VAANPGLVGAPVIVNIGTNLAMATSLIGNSALS
jgi:hypothetical protein